MGGRPQSKLKRLKMMTQMCSAVALTKLGGIILFEIAAVIYLPFPPAESPIFLFPELSRTEVLVACAIGKGIAVFLLLNAGAGLRGIGSRFLNNHSTVKMPKILQRAAEPWKRFVSAVIDKGGIWGFFLCNAIPFMPMRTAVAIAAFSAIDRWIYTAVAMVAAIFRTYLIFVMFQRYYYKLSYV